MQIPCRTELAEMGIQVTISNSQRRLKLGEAAGARVKQYGEARSHVLMKDRIEGGRKLHSLFAGYLKTPCLLVPAPAWLAAQQMHTAQPTIDIYGCKGVLLLYEYPNAV